MTKPAERPTPETNEFLSRSPFRTIMTNEEAIIVDFARRLERERDEARQQLSDHESSFKLRWAADMRAIKRWQAEAPGRELTWPDHADLCVWLLAERDALRAALRELLNIAIFGHRVRKDVIDRARSLLGEAP